MQRPTLVSERKAVNEQSGVEGKCDEGKTNGFHTCETPDRSFPAPHNDIQVQSPHNSRELLRYDRCFGLHAVVILAQIWFASGSSTYNKVRNRKERCAICLL
jgi:hypothetical protein